MFIGYARVSTTDQNLDLQQDALTKAGCEQVFTDMVSGAIAARPGLEQALTHVRKGDTLVVWRLDRLGRSLRHLIDLTAQLEKAGVGLKSVQESIDTTTPSGKLVFQIFGALAEFERNLIRERTQAGLAAARARGRKGGRRPKLDEKKRELLRQLYEEIDPETGAKKHSVKDICAMIGISKAAMYRYLAPPSS